MKKSKARLVKLKYAHVVVTAPPTKTQKVRGKCLMSTMENFDSETAWGYWEVDSSGSSRIWPIGGWFVFDGSSYSKCSYLKDMMM